MKFGFDWSSGLRGEYIVCLNIEDDNNDNINDEDDDDAGALIYYKLTW